MTTAEDLRDLRDAIESISIGALPRWGKPTTKTGEAAIKALAEMYKKYVSAKITESSARVAMEQSLQHEDNYRTHSEILTDYVEKLEKERDNLKAEIVKLKEQANKIREDAYAEGRADARSDAAVEAAEAEWLLFFASAY
jgi:flagellar biosynthesis/type III secretory pathway protein FliH